MRKHKGSGMMNEIVEITEIIIDYEDEGYMETENEILLISDCKFSFRDKITGEVEVVEYSFVEREYDKFDYSDEELDQMELCVRYAQEKGFVLEF